MSHHDDFATSQMHRSRIEQGICDSRTQQVRLELNVDEAYGATHWQRVSNAPNLL